MEEQENNIMAYLPNASASTEGQVTCHPNVSFLLHE
jgi:hypothetical protein